MDEIKKASEEIVKSLKDKSSSDDNFPAYVRLVLRRVVEIRSLAYTSEVAEAVRPIVHKYIVAFGYALSFGYVGVDIMLKLHDIKEQSNEVIGYTALDLTLWHSSASIVAPAVTIHTIVNGITKFQNKFIYTSGKIPSRFGKIVPSLIGLMSIPLIIHPIDKLTDVVMDKFIRPFYPIQISHKKHD